MSELPKQERCDSNTVHWFWRPGPLPGEHSCMAEAHRNRLLRCLIFKLYYPVGFADELGPALHAVHSIGINRLPGRTHWLLEEFHTRLNRSPVCLLRIAIDAGQYTVRPCGLAALCARDYVVDRPTKWKARDLNRGVFGLGVKLPVISPDPS